MAVINGTDLYVFVSGLPLAHATSHSLSFKMSTRDTSDKASGIWLTKAPGRMDVTITAEGLCAYGQFESIANSMITRAPLSIFLGKASDASVSGMDSTSGSYASGIFYVTSWDHTAGQEANATYSVTFDHASGFLFYAGMTEA